MSLLEFLGESYNPGEYGTIDFKKKNKSPKPNYIHLKFFISISIILGFNLAYLNSSEVAIKEFLILNGSIIIYLFIAYITNIVPNTKNLGWVPFVIDNPFRYSDDINRISVFILIILWPGKFISSSIINLYRYHKTT